MSSRAQATTISGHQKTQIAAHAHRSWKTVDRVYRGQGNDYSREAVTEAAIALGLPVPPGIPVEAHESTEGATQH